MGGAVRGSVIDDSAEIVNMATKWSCPQCTLENQASAEACKACSRTRDSNSELSPAQIQERQQSGPVEWKRRPRQSPGSSLWGRIAGEWELYWSCPTCKRQNESTVCQCPFCGYIATNVSASGDPGQRPSSATGASIAVTLKKFVKKISGTEEARNTGRTDSVEVTGWTCSSCKFTNHPDLMYCEQCGRGFKLVKDTVTSRVLNTSNDPALDEIVTPGLLPKEKMVVPSPVPIPKDKVPVPGPLSDTHAETSFNKWVCPYCTAENDAQYSQCQVCEMPWSGNEDIEQINDLSISADVLPEPHAHSQSGSHVVSGDVPLLHQQSSLTVQEIREIEEMDAMDTYRHIVEEYKKVSAV